jgi:hypothetical protein
MQLAYLKFSSTASENIFHALAFCITKHAVPTKFLVSEIPRNHFRFKVKYKSFVLVDYRYGWASFIVFRQNNLYSSMCFFYFAWVCKLRKNVKKPVNFLYLNLKLNLKFTIL